MPLLKGQAQPLTVYRVLYESMARSRLESGAGSHVQRQGRRAEARALLAPIYGWFTEGYDTADLQEAQVLLDTLAT